MSLPTNWICLPGETNGLPPLHPNMPIKDWSAALGNAYAALINRMDHHSHTYINTYAASNPAEFFAVLCEYFFTSPQTFELHCPEVYQQLKLYFRQEPVI